MTGGEPRVAVLLPVRDAASTLGTALASLSAQTLAGFEVVIVDDGSRDDTVSVALDWIAGFDSAPQPSSSAAADTPSRRARLVRNPRDGLVPALQRGLAQVRTAFAARMDGDDICHPRRLAAQLAYLDARPELAGCGTGVRMVPESAVTPRAAEYAGWLNGLTSWSAVRRDIFVECPLAHPTFMFRTRALRAVDGYRDQGWPEDYDLLLRLWRCGRRFATLPETLLDWTDSADRTSRTNPAYSLDALRRCRVHHLRRTLLAGRPGVVVWGAGPTGKALAREFRAQGVPVLGFVDVDPRKIGQEVHGVPVWASPGSPEPTDAPKTAPGSIQAAPAPNAAGFADALHVGAVARAEGRQAVRTAAAKAGLEDGRNFVAMA